MQFVMARIFDPKRISVASLLLDSLKPSSKHFLLNLYGTSILRGVADNVDKHKQRTFNKKKVLKQMPQHA